MSDDIYLKGRKDAYCDKYDWDKLKQEFIFSEYDFARDFVDAKGLPRNPNTDRFIKGWGAERKKKRLEVLEKELNKSLTKQAKVLAAALNNMVGWFTNQVATEEQLKKINSAKQAKIIWEVLRTENNLPTKITKNTNINFEAQEEEKAFNELDSHAGDIKDENPEGPKDPIKGENV